MNPKTGQLDLSKFQSQLQQSGLTLESYANKLQAIGPIGEQAFLRVASAIAKAELPLTRSNTLLNSLWITMKNTMRWQLTASALHGFIGAIETAYGYAQDLDESLTNIRIVTNQSAEEMENFAKQANEAAKALSTTTVDYTDAALIYYQQGLSEQEVLDRTETTIKMANAAGISAETASEQLTAVWNNFYDGSKSLEYYADVMVRLGADTASSSDEIAEGIQQFASVADTVGLSYEYAASALATVTATTRESANTVGTAFRTLFARIQGLNLGETLDDGTTLNKYSQALQKVGIDIFDVNGEIKSMDTLLEEMGAKWETLANDQQIALAQTVAGVRQYTRLIALMDNWDFFQENLQSAYGAEGSLQEQADIYAQSWEAARDRVRASAEDIYDSLMNEDFFIDFDNGLATMLSGTADVVDALGGMKGVITLTGIAFTSAFGDKLAQGLRDIAYNFTVISGKADEVQRKLKQDAGTVALNMVTNSSAMSSNTNITKAQIQAEDIQMQNQLNAVARQLTEEQQKQLLGYKDIITQIKTMALEYDEIVAQRRVENEEIQNTILGLENVQKNSIAYYNTLKSASKELQSIPKMMSLTQTTDGKYGNSLESLVNSYKNLSVAGAQLSTISQQFKGIDTSIQGNEVLVESLRKKFTELTGINLAGNLTDDISQVDAALKSVDNALDKLYTRLQNSGVNVNILEQFRVGTSTVGESLQNAAYASDVAAKETEKYMLSVYNATLKQKDWASVIVTGSNKLMQLGLALQSIKNVNSIWNNEDLTTGEKMIQTLTSLGMILPTVVSLIKLATSAQTTYNAVTIEGTAVTEAQILAANTLTGATGAHTTAKIVETKVVNENTTAIIANTKALYTNPIFWIVASVIAVIAAYTAYTSVVEENTKKQIENAKATAEASQENANALKEEREEISTLYQEYIDLRSRMDESSEAKEDLKQHTEDLCEALGVEWDALDKLQGKYDEVNKKIAEANKEAILSTIKDTQRAIEDTQYSITRQASEYDEYMATHEGYEGLSYKIDFGAGFNGADEQEVKDIISNVLSESGYEGQVITAANAGLQVYAESAEQFVQAYELISQAVSDARESLDEATLNSSEVFQNAYSWVQDYSNEYEKIVQYNEDLNNYAQQLAEAEAAIVGYDLANVNTYEEYSQYEDQYIDQLRKSYEEAGILTDEMTEEYFRGIARKYLSEYTNLADQVAEADVADAIIEAVGEDNKDKVQQIIDSGDYDLDILGRLDWDFIFNQDDVDSALEEQYNKVKDQIDATEFEELLPQVNSIMSDLLEGNDLTEDQITQLEALEEEYSKLASIRDRGSSQYIQALRDIREGMEDVISSNAINTLKDAWDQLQYISEQGSAEISVDLDDSDFQENMKQILDADYKVQVAIESDLKSDIDDILNYADAVQQATNVIQEGFKVSYEDIDTLTAAFPGILAGYTITADGMIQLNAEIAQSSIDLASTQIAADKDAAKKNIESYQQVLLAKAAAMRTIAEGLWSLTQDSEDNADAQAKIEQGLTDFKSACADEQSLVSEGLAESEIDDSNQIMVANENAAGTSANNWADAYDSMAANSAKWAQIAIANANAVAKAMKGAEEGKVVTPEVSTGGIFSSYSGGFEEAEYSGTYESRGQGNVDWFDYYESGDYQAAYEAAIQQAEGYESAAAALSGMLAKLDGASSTVDNLVNTVGKDTGSKSGDNEGTKYDAEDEKTLEDIEDRYHEINREIEDQNSLLEDIQENTDRAYGTKKLENYQKELEALYKQQDNYNQKLAEAQQYLKLDQTNLQSLFGNQIIFKENGEISNYQGVLQSIIDDYNNNFLADYNSFLAAYSALTKDEQEARQAEYDSWQTQKEIADQLYQKRLDALSQYEDTLDVIQEIEDSLEDTAREIADNKLNQIEYRLEVVITAKDMRDAVRDLTKEIVESFGDLLTHGLESTNIGWEQAQADMDMLKEYQQTYSEYQNELANATDATDIDRIIGNLEDLQGQAISTAEALLSWIESIETLLPDAIDDAAERFSLFTDQLEHNESVLSTIKELYELQGVTYKTSDGFSKLQKVSQETLEAQVGQAQLQKTWYENAKQALLQAEADLAGVSETDAAYDTLKNNRDALLAEFNEAQEAMLSSAQSAMETAQEIYTQAIEKAVYDFGQAISGGIGLDLLQDKFDHYIETEERYLDKVNEAYEVASWYNKLQTDIDNTTNSTMKEQLKALQDEINIRRQNNTLSEYDLEILEAKYNVLQAQMALEDAQNAKNELRLVRDSQGNWNYQYTADADQIADAEQNLLDAENEWYNIAKQQVEDVTGEIIQAWQDCQDEIKDIYSDMSLTDQERADKAEEIYKYYTEKIKYLEEEKQIAIEDMTQAGNESLLDMAIVSGDEISDLTGITSQEIQDIISNSGMSIIELLNSDNEKIKEIIGSNTELIDLFDNVFAEDLSNMTSNAMSFEDMLSKALEEAENSFNEYQNTVSNVANETGTNLDDLAGYVDNVSTSTDICTEAGLNAADSMWEQLYAIQDLSVEYANLADSVYEYIYALRELAAEMASTVGNESSGTNHTPGTDDSTSNSSGGGSTSGGGGSSSSGGTISHSEMVQLAYDIGRGVYDNNPVRKQLVESQYPGAYSQAQKIVNQAIAQDEYNYRHNASAWRQTIEKLVSQAGFDTGGYTGEFDNAKLAFLHEKELVLNQDDTKNILQSVQLVRTLSGDFIKTIETMLDNNVGAAAGLMSARLNDNPQIAPNYDTIEQNVTIEHVEFPNVTSSDEIQDAFRSIIDDAAQWVHRRKE